MNTDRLFEFQVLAQTLHFGKAAEKLFISQSVLSRHIQELENELGAQLFIRSSHSVSLTASGASLYRASDALLREDTRAREKAHAASLGIKGGIKFACMRPNLTEALSLFLSTFSEHYPDVFLHVDIFDNDDQIPLGEYDFISLPTFTVKIPDVFRHIGTFHEKSYLISSGDPDIKPGTIVSISSLAGKVLFIPGYPGSLGAFSKIAQQVKEATSGQIRIVRVSTVETAMLNVFLRRGIAILPRHRVNEASLALSKITLAEDLFFDNLLFENSLSNEKPAAELFGREMMKYMAHFEESQ